MIRREITNALIACALTFLLCAVAYPALVWGLGNLAFPRKAAGSLIYSRDRTVIGSELIAQPFVGDKYFHPRPSAADYKADAATGSNLGTKNPDLRAKLVSRAQAFDGRPELPVPVDLVMASGSGLDPHITLLAAQYQAVRVATARKRPIEEIRALIEKHADRSGAVIGAVPRVNVLLLNLDLDELRTHR
jgi:K+-transporting ATPase ATPase C chain